MDIKVVVPPDDVDKAEQIVADACESVNLCSSSPRTSGGDQVDRVRDGSRSTANCRADLKRCLSAVPRYPFRTAFTSDCGVDVFFSVLKLRAKEWPSFVFSPFSFCAVDVSVF